MSTLTPWFPARIKPVRNGVYMVEPVYDNFFTTLYAYWNQKTQKWGGGGLTPERAMLFKNMNGYQLRMWRGVERTK
jgi:hypothetical protein